MENKQISKMAASVVGSDNNDLSEFEIVKASKCYGDRIAIIGGCDPLLKRKILAAMSRYIHILPTQIL